ncbi:hypothetical protein TELCIR_06324 [Teladorsagia circumcincta]|uniref:Uncharacterized protein n=1 Tax=Teladorsagia circumcincta TaxID=45464 RepID=A0A2G9UNE3_TELCI|nr:hypothetical protein TELCIR_06324 [Teladorsagia circumcincta]
MGKSVRANFGRHKGPILKEDVSNVLSAIFPGATPQQLSGLADLTKLNRTPVPPPQRMGSGYAGHPGGGKVPMPVAPDRRAVAEYARAYGGAAAAKRFGIAPPVSTYYQRKDSNSKGEADPMGQGASESGATAVVTASSQLNPSSISNISNPIASLQQQPTTLGSLPTSQPQTASVSAPAAGQPAAQGMFSPAMVDMLRMNAAHATGSPGFLRGRGRGRPKLIGDELDADLVDYMVTVKQADPHGHLTASQALIIAKQYILEKAPGLLEEHGGHVKLKLTWAMKLVSRIAERQKEIELGLPAVGAPEILNIKELNLPFLNNLFGCTDENSGVIEGELPASAAPPEHDQEMNLGNVGN